jgi:hypothetical protein
MMAEPVKKSSFRQFVKKLDSFVKHPRTKLFVGLILVATSAYEIGSDLLDDIPGVNIGAHHGLLILGIINALSSIPDMVEGLEHAIEGTEHLNHERLDTEAPDE